MWQFIFFYLPSDNIFDKCTSFKVHVILHYQNILHKNVILCFCKTQNIFFSQSNILILLKSQRAVSYRNQLTFVFKIISSKEIE